MINNVSKKDKVVKRLKTIYKLKITLKDIKPPIWRRFIVNADVTLPSLHKIIQTVMGWSNSHLHQFRVDGIIYCEPHEDNMIDYIDYRRVKLSKLIKFKGEKIYYDYDFGDGWYHEIKLEKVLTTDVPLIWPMCLDGARRSPPEDCGGAYGYEEILEIIKNPEHEEYEERMAWLPYGFNPEEFSVEYTNRLLAQKNFGCITF